MIKLFSSPRVLVLLLSLPVSFSMFAQPGLKLWYDKPATERATAFPLGNGFIGAVVYGNPLRESVQLNEATVWGSREEGYQPVGSLIIQFSSHKKTTGYIRELNLSDALAVTRYNCGGVVYTREYLTSMTDSVLLIRLRASKPKSITCDISLSTTQQRFRLSDDGLGMLMLNGSAGNLPQSEAVRFAVRARPLAKNGRCMVRNNVFSVQGADEVTICLSIASGAASYNKSPVNETARATRVMASAYGKDFDQLKAKHIKAYQSQFNRVSLDLGTSPQAGKATGIRVKESANAADPALISLLFQYGRYLMISSSQPGGQPAALNGLWSNPLQPVSALKCNTALANYWSSEATRLTESEAPLFRMIAELAVTGRQLAREKYGVRGWAAGQSADLWRNPSAAGGGNSAGSSLGAAWLCRVLWEHYLYTGDKAFLAEYYPVMADAARFFADCMLKDPKNAFQKMTSGAGDSKAQQSNGGVFAASEEDVPAQALVNDVLVAVIRATDVLNGGIRNLFGNEATAFADTLRKLLPRLQPLQAGQKNSAGITMQDLYALCPGSYVSPYRTPDVFSLMNKLFSESETMAGASPAWQLVAAARLLDGQLAYKIVQKQSGSFDLDFGSGFTAGVAEMLIQSYDGFVSLLPALPAAWKSGTVKGVAARGGFTFDVFWKQGRVDKLVVHSALGGNLRLRSASALTSKGLKAARGENPNPLYCVEKSFCQLSPDVKDLSSAAVRETFLYDLKTEAGQTLEILPVLH